METKRCESGGSTVNDSVRENTKCTTTLHGDVMWDSVRHLNRTRGIVSLGLVPVRKLNETSGAHHHCLHALDHKNLPRFSA